MHQVGVLQIADLYPGQLGASLRGGLLAYFEPFGAVAESIAWLVSCWCARSTSMSYFDSVMLSLSSPPSQTRCQ
jgi:hypothetical protein